MSDVALADLDGALAGTETIVAGITPGQWGAPTPCTGLDVRTLVNHLVTGNLLFAALVTGTRPSPSDGGWTPFAPEVPVPDGAPAINRLAGFLGRAVLSARRIPGGRSVA